MTLRAHEYRFDRAFVQIGESVGAQFRRGRLPFAWKTSYIKPMGAAGGVRMNGVILPLLFV